MKNILLCILISLLAVPCSAEEGAEKKETGPEAATAEQRVELASPELAATAESRQRLKYLVGCALQEEMTLYTVIENKEYEFTGSLGLAPSWLRGAITPEEERWVSACILARTNFFGKRVTISMHAPAHSSPP